jgi:hypothetical protein
MTHPDLLLLIFVHRLVEEEVCGEFFVLVAGEVGLDDEITFEAETTKLSFLVRLINNHGKEDLHVQ